MSKFFSIFVFLLPLYLFSANNIDQGLAIIYKKGLAHINNEDIRLALDILLQEMLKNKDILIKTEFTDDLEKAINDFKDAKADLLSMSFIYYLQEYDRIFPYVKDSWILTAKKNDSFRRFFLLVNKKSNITSLAELRGKKIGLHEADSMQELYIDTLLLEKQGVQSKEFFGEKIYYPKFSRALLKLFFNKIDACIVSKNAWDIAVELNPQIKNKLKIMNQSSDIFPPDALVLTHKTSPIYATLYENFAIKLQHDSRATQVFNIYQIAESVKVNGSSLAPIISYYKHYVELRKQLGIENAK